MGVFLMKISAIVIMIMLDIEKHHGNWNLCIGRYNFL